MHAHNGASGQGRSWTELPIGAYSVAADQPHNRIWTLQVVLLVCSSSMTPFQATCRRLSSFTCLEHWAHDHCHSVEWPPKSPDPSHVHSFHTDRDEHRNQRQTLFLEKLGYRPPFKGNRFTVHGTKSEPIALEAYRGLSAHIVQGGIGADTLGKGPTENWLAASPDGLIDAVLPGERAAEALRELAH